MLSEQDLQGFKVRGFRCGNLIDGVQSIMYTAVCLFDVRKEPCMFQESPFGGKLDGLTSPDFTTRTKVSVFKPLQSPPHFSTLDRLASFRRSGTQKPPRNSRSSASFLCLICSSSLLGGRPGRRCCWASSSCSSSRSM